MYKTDYANHNESLHLSLGTNASVYHISRKRQDVIANVAGIPQTTLAILDRKAIGVFSGGISFSPNKETLGASGIKGPIVRGRIANLRSLREIATCQIR